MVTAHLQSTKVWCYKFGPSELQHETEKALAPSQALTTTTVKFVKQNIGGDKYKDDFNTWQEKLKDYDTTTACGRVWGSEYIAYRCRTCAHNSCMSLCADCFEAGDHEGHDFNMFRSGAGGACDCGDTSVMDIGGICPQHKTSDKRKKEVPAELLTPSSGIIIKVFSQ